MSFKLKREPGSYALMLIDGDSAFGGQAHLLRVAVSGDRLTIAQDRGSLASKMEQAKAKSAAKKAGQPMAKPTPATAAFSPASFALVGSAGVVCTGLLVAGAVVGALVGVVVRGVDVDAGVAAPVPMPRTSVDPIAHVTVNTSRAAISSPTHSAALRNVESPGR